MPGENLDVVVARELFGVACCMGSGVVVLKVQYHTIFDAQNNTAKKQTKKAFLSLNSIHTCYVNSHTHTHIHTHTHTHAHTHTHIHTRTHTKPCVAKE